MIILFAIFLSFYTMVNVLELFGSSPEFTFSSEPIHFEKNQHEKEYTAWRDRFHWNFGVGMKGIHRYKNFDISDNDYVQVIGLQHRNDNNSQGSYFKSAKLEKCTHAKNAPFTNKEDFESWYPNALCFPQNNDTII